MKLNKKKKKRKKQKKTLKKNKSKQNTNKPTINLVFSFFSYCRVQKIKVPPCKTPKERALSVGKINPFLLAVAPTKIYAGEAQAPEGQRGTRALPSSLPLTPPPLLLRPTVSVEPQMPPHSVHQQQQQQAKRSALRSLTYSSMTTALLQI